MPGFPAYPSYTAVPTPGFEPLSVVFTFTGSGPESYYYLYWYMGDGTVIYSDTDTPVVSHIYTDITHPPFSVFPTFA